MGSRWQDTPAAILLRLLADLLILNLLSILCSFGIITIGASLSAMYAVLFRREEDEGVVSVFKTYFRAFGHNFLKATALELIMVVLVLVAGVDFLYATNIEEPGHTVFVVVSVMVAVLALAVFVMAFPQQAIYRNTLRNYLKNSVSLTFCAPVAFLLSVAAWVGPWVLALIESDVLVYLGVLYLLWGFSLPAWVTVKLLRKVFSKTKQETTELTE